MKNCFRRRESTFIKKFFGWSSASEVSLLDKGDCNFDLNEGLDIFRHNEKCNMFGHNE